PLAALPDQPVAILGREGAMPGQDQGRAPLAELAEPPGQRRGVGGALPEPFLGVRREPPQVGPRQPPLRPTPPPPPAPCPPPPPNSSRGREPRAHHGRDGGRPRRGERHEPVPAMPGNRPEGEGRGVALDRRLPRPGQGVEPPAPSLDGRIKTGRLGRQPLPV